jgi:hypothetical protein
MTRYVALRPYGHWWFTKSITFQNGVVFDRLPGDLRPNFDDTGWGELFSRRHIRYLSKTSYWIYRSFEDERGPGSRACAEAMGDVDHAALAFLVDCPAELNSTEFPETSAVCEVRGHELVPCTVFLHQPYYGFSWARVIREPRSAESRIGLIAEGITQSIAKRVTRLVNAFRLLELGLQSTEPYIKLLLWVGALDSLLMANSARHFVARLKNFLGAQTFVFAGSDGLGQPSFRVADIADDLYELRSVIAHGRRIPDKYWKPTEFKERSKEPLAQFDDCKLYHGLLSGCALFLLCTALRKIYLGGLLERVADSGAWRSLLDRSAPARG